MEPGKEEPFAVHSDIKWAAICYVSVRRFRKIVKKMADLRLIDLRSTGDLPQISSGSPGNRSHIEVRNILKYKDEYSKKSGVSPEQLSLEQKRTEQNTAAENSTKLVEHQQPAAKPPMQNRGELADRLITHVSDTWELDRNGACRIIDACREVKPDLTWDELRWAAKTAYKPDQRGPMLFERTMPAVLRNAAKRYG